MPPHARMMAAAFVNQDLFEGRLRCTDDFLAGLIAGSPDSVPALLQTIAEFRYIEPPGRKSGGERDLVIHQRWIEEIR